MHEAHVEATSPTAASALLSDPVAVEAIGTGPCPLLLIDLRPGAHGATDADTLTRLAGQLRHAPFVTAALARPVAEPAAAEAALATDVILSGDPDATAAGTGADSGPIPADIPVVTPADLVRPPGAATPAHPGAATAAAMAARVGGTDVAVSADPGVEPPGRATSTTNAGAARASLDALTQRLAAAVAASPHAATTLAEVLRLGEALPMRGALVTESLAYSTLQSGPEFRTWLHGRSTTPAAVTALHPVRVERDGARMQITLNDPARRNAFSARMRDALMEQLRLAELDTSITDIHIDGEGRSFCAGGDLAEFGTTPDPASAHRVRMVRSPAMALHRLAARTTMHVHGHAFGAGIELAAIAGHVCVAPGTLAGLPEVAMGLIPGAGGTASLPRRIGRHRTAWMALTGAHVDATTGLRWGLYDRLAHAGERAGERAGEGRVDPQG